ncbi:MAG TPA: FtsX-like permease family protein [Gemmatimonadales bacterium]
MISPRFVVRMARRELRAEAGRLGLLVGAVGIGVAALVAVNSFTENLQDSVRQQARALLGADLAVSSRAPFSATVEAVLDSIPVVASARVTNFPAMAYVPRTAGTRLVQASAVAGPFPFYGEIKTTPASAWRELQDGRRVVVDPVLLTALNARVGDTLALGAGRFLVTGTLTNLPGDVGVRAAFGPRIFIPATYLEETRLLGFGAQAERQAFFKLRPGASAEALAGRLRPELRPDHVRVRTVAEDRQDLNDLLTRLSRYLGLVALIALLLGGIGVGSAVLVFVRRKLETIAVLRCLGATARQVFAVYLTQAAVLGLAGSAAGALLGVLVQQALPSLLRGLLPVDVQAAIAPREILLGIGLGTWTALVFALLPLLAVRRVSPLAAIRRPYENAPTDRDPWRWPAAVVLAASVVALAALEVGSWRTGAIFSAGIGFALGTLWLAAWLLVRAVRRWFPARWPYVWRQGLANLFRPANQTVAVVLALGFGAFLLSTLFLVQHNLLRGLETSGGPRRPNLVLLDIQTDQAEAVARELQARGLPEYGPVPIVPMRIISIKGTPVTQLFADSAATVPGIRRRRRDAGGGGGEPSNTWALRREYRSTYRDTVVASERVVAGTWTGSAPAGATAGEPVSISVEQDLAGELGVTVGDEIVWDVQGVAIPSRVTSLREVEWARFEPNFFVVFAKGRLEQAPQTLVALTRIDDAAVRGKFQRELVERYANLTTIDLALIQEQVERLVGRVTLAIRFMAAFSLAVGALVLVGAIATTRLQRLRESVLLRTLGATRRQILRIALAEYLALGLLSSLTAVVLAAGAGWGLAKWFFDGRFWLPVAPLAALVAAVVGLTVVVGLWTTREAVRRPPLEVLRV